MAEAIHFLSLLDVSERIRRGRLSAIVLTEAMLERIAVVDPSFNSYLLVTADLARRQARQADAEIASGRWRGPLHGVPIAVKDLCFTAGIPTTFGMKVYEGFVPDADGTVVKRLADAGSVLLGKLHLHEGAFGEHHASTKTPLNPWNKAYWPGGSSSGSGIATAAGLCFGSLGSDTGGSIRFPSNACGVTGLKPTWGRVSRHGAFPLAESLDTLGPMTRTAADAAAMLTAIAGHDPADPTSLSAPVPDYLAALDGVWGARGLTIGIDRSYVGSPVDAEVLAVVEAALEVLARIGARVVSVEMPDVRPVAEGQLSFCEVESATFHEAAYRATPELFGVLLGKAVAHGLAHDPLVYARHQMERDRFKGRLARLFDEIDALIVPVSPRVGIRYDAFDEFMNDIAGQLRFTGPFNMAGNPTLTLPGGLSSGGLPIGFQLVGPHLSEAKLLAAGHALQMASDWHLRRPPV